MTPYYQDDLVARLRETWCRLRYGHHDETERYSEAVRRAFR